MKRLNSNSETAGVPHPLFLDIPAIPGIRGLYKDFFAKNFPGWEWNQIIPVLIKKGIIKVGSKEADQQVLSQGLSISKDMGGVLLMPSKHQIKVAIQKITTH